MTFMCLYLCMAMPSNLAPLVPLVAATPPVVMWSRVRLGLHTPAQCLVGATLGVACALFATVLWTGFGSHAGLAQRLAPRGDHILRQLESNVRGHIGV
jgi:dolichyldiphosphatase